MPVNRKLGITVTFSCTKNGENDFGGGAIYTQASCLPSDMGDIVAPDGTIDFSKANAYNSGDYNENVDIEFTLVTPCSVSPGGATIPVIWATQYGAGMTIAGNPTEMSVVFDSNTPNLICIQDKDDDNNVYNYKPAVELVRPNLPNYYIGLDPKIVNRPRT